MYSLGIDIGYSSVKTALVDEKGSVGHVKYTLHKGDVKGAILGHINEIADKYDLSKIEYGAVTGSGGKIFLKTSGVETVNEAAALVEGASAADGRARSIIEIGGQSAKYITGLGTREKSGIQIAMNSNCSAGTGSFLEEQCSRLNLELEDYSKYAARAGSTPRIAGRCSVFAKTDITHHQQEGVPVEDILLGLAYAVVRNYRVAVMRKLNMEKPIMLLGGVARNEGILTALKDVLELGDDELIIPEDMDSLGAVGAAVMAEKDGLKIDIESLISGLNQTGELIDLNESINQLPCLAEFGVGDSEGKHEHIGAGSSNGKIDCFLGVDVGSTSTNLVLSDSDDNIIAFRYLRTLGRPVEAVRKGLASLKKEFGDRLNVLGAATTGSGRYMTGRLIGADVIKDEITAQAKAAITMDPEVDTIFEIGGQDSKYISIKDGVVVDFQMNKICAAGTGSFIEEQAKKFNIPLFSISESALAGKQPISLGERCTVFMETSIAAHLGRGADMPDITAGLCYAIVKNYLGRVVGQKKVGNKIFFQGGVAYNQGVINAFRHLTGKEITIPPFFSVSGAYGAAILAREATVDDIKTSFKGFDPALDQVIPKSEEIPDDGKALQSDYNKAIEALVFEGYTGKLDPDKKTVGIPRALFTYGMFTMFNRIFKELGFNVLLSDPTSEKTIALGQEYSLDETCYPVKLINGHVAELVNKKVDYIFFPDLYTVDHPGSPSRQNYGCAYMQLAFKVVNQAMDLQNKGISLLAPTIAFSLGREFMMKSFAGMGRQLGKTPEETFQALQQGMKAFLDFEVRMEATGKQALAKLDPNKKAFVLVSKIYGVADPVLNMGIPDKLAQMGYQTLPFFYLPEGDLSKEHPNLYWPFEQHVLEPAQIIREHPNLYAILLTHHGCGPDSVVAHYFRETMQDKPYLHIEVDEHSSGVGVATRVEAFVNSLNNLETKAAEDITVYPDRVQHEDENMVKDFKAVGRNGDKVQLPYIYPYADIFREMLTAAGIGAEVLPMTSRDSVDAGRKFTIAEEYHSLTALMGDVFSKCRAENNGGRLTFLIPRTEGAEVDGQYSRMIRMKLNEEGYSHVDVISPYVEDLLDADETNAESLFLGLIAGDLVRLAPPRNREKYLVQVLTLIRRGWLSIHELEILAGEINRDLEARSYTKRILAVGEPLVLYNDFMNDDTFKNIEDNGRQVLYAPLSETMWMFWRDYVYQNGSKENHLKLLRRFEEYMEGVAGRLKEESPFERNLNSLVRVADGAIGYYAGAFGRFRGAKVLGDLLRIDGIITAASTYENTGISLNILHKAFDGDRQTPILNLTFDGNRNENDVAKCESFIYYL